jgi:hypothetical protein
MVTHKTGNNKSALKNRGAQKICIPNEGHKMHPKQNSRQSLRSASKESSAEPQKHPKPLSPSHRPSPLPEPNEAHTLSAPSSHSPKKLQYSATSLAPPPPPPAFSQASAASSSSADAQPSLPAPSAQPTCFSLWLPDDQAAEQ